MRLHRGQTISEGSPSMNITLNPKPTEYVPHEPAELLGLASNAQNHVFLQVFTAKYDILLSSAIL